MTYFKVAAITFIALLTITGTASASVDIPTPEDTYQELPLPLMPPLIKPEMPEVAAVSTSDAWAEVNKINNTMAKKAKCVRKKKKCRVSESQVETWNDELNSYYDEIGQIIDESYEDRLYGSLDSMRLGQEERLQETENTRDEAYAQVKADRDADYDAVDDYEEEQRVNINNAYQDLVSGQTIEWDGQAVDFNTLNASVCGENHPTPESQLDPNDPGKAWNDACASVRQALSDWLAIKEQKRKEGKKAFKAWEKEYKKRKNKAALCGLESLKKLEASLRSQLDKHSKAKKKDNAWKKKRDELRRQLDQVRANIAKAERYAEYDAEEKEYDAAVEQAGKDLEECTEDANEASADEWIRDRERELEELLEDSKEAADELARERDQDVERWAEKSDSLNSEAQEREQEDATFAVEKIRREETRRMAKLERRSNALLRSF